MFEELKAFEETATRQVDLMAECLGIAGKKTLSCSRSTWLVYMLLRITAHFVVDTG